MKLALIGYGKMGRAVEEVAIRRGHEIVVRLDAEDNAGAAGIVPDRLAAADVAIEFTQPDAAPANIEKLAACGIASVVGTTGWYDRLDDVRRAVERAGIGLIYAPNFSLGTHLFLRLARAAARLGDRIEEYDAFVLEAHHRHKADHPSGTARRLAELVLQQLSRKTGWALVASGQGTVDPAKLQVSVVRAGENPGMHEFSLDGPDDLIQVRHTARSRLGFARGAVAAAEWIQGREGLYTIDDMLTDTLGPEQ